MGDRSVEIDTRRMRIGGLHNAYNAMAAALATLAAGVAPAEAACAQSGDKLFLPELRYCGDNGAMIGCQGYYEFLAGHTAGAELNAYATRDISLG